MDLRRTPATCPDCGGRLSVEPHCVVEVPTARWLYHDRPLDRRTRIVPVVLMCDCCEYCEEVEQEMKR